MFYLTIGIDGVADGPHELTFTVTQGAEAISPTATFNGAEGQALGYLKIESMKVTSPLVIFKISMDGTSFYEGTLICTVPPAAKG